MRDPVTCDRRERRALRPSQRTIVRALSEALFSDEDPRGVPVPPAPELLDRLVEEFDYTVGAASSDLRRGFVVLCALIENLPPAVIRTPGRMSRLPLATRIDYLRALEHSRIGLLATLVVAFKIPLVMVAYEQGEELVLTGFDRPTLSHSRGTEPVREPKGPLIVVPKERAS